MARLHLIPAALLVLSSACGGTQRGAESAEPIDDFDQQQWARTSPIGDGIETSSGYHGAPGYAADPPERQRQPAEPSFSGGAASNQRHPASPGTGRSQHEPY